MGSSVCCSVLLTLSLLGLYCGVPSVLSQELRERDALCNEEGCFVVYFQRKTFLDSWRSCKDKGGNLATIKLQKEADSIAALFSGVELRGSRTNVKVWIGLQRQPRQCTASRPLRGFSWTTGDQDTQYTNWLREDSPNTCSAPRCVVMSYSTAGGEQRDNFKWLDGSCSVPVDGYLCRFTYKGMCPAVWSEGGGNALYSTPFSLLSTLLTHVPFGSVAAVPCPAGTKEQQSVLCMLREDGTVGWSRDAPLCSDVPENSWCDGDNRGCEHICREAGTHYYCECSEGYQLGEDGESCILADTCHGAPCEFECLPLPDGYRCACPEGYMLAPDERGCLDVDECLQSPCEQLCVNAPGTFECRCREGYRPDEEGECDDVDECMGDPCEHACENTPGSHICHCHLGFSPLPEDHSRCQDTDECQIPGTCEQMCVNYEGGFECYCEEGYQLMSDHFSCRRIVEGEDLPTATPSYPWVTHHPDPMWDPRDPVYRWTPHQTNTDWPTEDDSLDWLTDPPRIESDVIWVTSAPQEEPAFNPGQAPSTAETVDEVEEYPDWEKPAFNPGQAPSTAETVDEVEEYPDWEKPAFNPAQSPTMAETMDEVEEYPDWQKPAFNPGQAPPTAETVDEVEVYPDWEKPAFNPAQAPPTAETVDEVEEYPDWEKPAFNPAQPPPMAETVDEVEEYTDWNTMNWRVPESSPSPTDTPTSTPTPMTDWYEEEEDETTTSPSALPTSTVSGGAWNWFWLSPTPASQDPGRTTLWHWKDIPTSEYDDEVVADLTTTPSSSQFNMKVVEVGEKGDEDYERVESPPAQETTSQPRLTALTPPGQGVVVDETVPEGDGSNQKQGGSWLLVGLLVPLCIFIVVMVALGIVYCTRCAVQPRNKSATDCYHWISGAHDKQGAPSSSVKQSHV